MTNQTKIITIILSIFIMSSCTVGPEIDKSISEFQYSKPIDNTPPVPGSNDSDPDSGTPPEGPGNTYEDEAGIQFFGRWDIQSSTNATASWGAVYLKARFEGTSIAIKLNDPNNDFNYRIDGGPMKLLSPSNETTYTLATGLTDGNHLLEFYRRSSGGWGKTVFNGLILDQGKQLLPPPTRPARRVEVIGDSISVGFGNEGGGGNSRAQENGYMAYGPQLARKFDAEWSIIGHSGQGVYRNLYENLPPTNDNMTDEFLMTHFPAYQAMPNTNWNFTNWHPHALLVVLGTNDFAGNNAPTQASFESAYSAFLSTIREKYPNTVIFAVGTFMYNWGAPNQFDNCNNYICNVVDDKNNQGDTNVHCINPGGSNNWLPNATDYVNDWTHPTIAGHTIIADNLYQIIKPIMGW